MPNDNKIDYEKVMHDLHIAQNKLRVMTGEEPKPFEQMEPPFCSFCGKCKTEVKGLIKGPSIFICSECIYKCVELLNEMNIDES